MALYFYFNETTGDMVYSDKATYDVAGYTSIGEQTNMNPTSGLDWIFDWHRSKIKTVSKDPAMLDRISGLTNMNGMFNNCSNLVSLDLSGFDTSQVTSMIGVFSGCPNLASLDLSSLDTSQVTNMARMFHDSSNLASLDLSGFDTSQVTRMAEMFRDCSNLASLDLSGFDTSHVTDMANMFVNCSNLASLDLSGFDTSHVTKMTSAFYGCSGLRLLTIGNNISNMLSELPVDQYYPASGGAPTAKANLTAGTWIRDKADLSMVTSIVEQAQMSQAISRRIGKLGRDLRAEIAKASAGSATPSVNVVRTDTHSTSYTKDTLEIVTDSTGKVTEMYFVSA